MLELVETENNIITLNVGREYLHKIADEFLVKEDDMEERKDCHDRINDFVNTISDKKRIDEFVLPNFLLKALSSVETTRMAESICEIEICEFKFKGDYLLYHILNTYKHFESDKKTKNIHLWLKLEPKEHTSNNTIEDTLPEFESIMCKFNLRKYKEFNNSKQNSADGWTYQLSFLYMLIIGNLYNILNKYISDENVTDFIEDCFIILNPIIVGFTVTTTYELYDVTKYKLHEKTKYKLHKVNALSIIHELLQLNSSGKQLHIKKDKTHANIKFEFNTLDKDFHSLLSETSEFIYERDNKGKRYASLFISGKANTLTCRMDFIGLGIIEDITGLAVNKSLYSLITDETELDAITYETFSYMLSHTQEYLQSLNRANEAAPKLYNPKNFMNIGIDKNEFKTKCTKIIRDKKLHKEVFTELEPETILEVSHKLVKKFGFKKYSMDNVIVANELAKKDDSVISERIKSWGSKQQAQMRKMIKFIRHNKTHKPKHVLNLFYKEVSYII